MATILDSDAFRDLCQKHVQFNEKYDENIIRIREYLAKNNIKTRDECNKYSKTIQQFLRGGLNEEDKSLLIRVSQIVGTLGKSKEDKVMTQRKLNIDKKINRHYDKLLNSLYGTPLPLFLPPIPVGNMEGTIAKLIVPVETNKRKSSDDIAKPVIKKHFNIRLSCKQCILTIKQDGFTILLCFLLNKCKKRIECY
jgi:hypothetical protein